MLPLHPPSPRAPMTETEFYALGPAHHPSLLRRLWRRLRMKKPGATRPASAVLSRPDQPRCESSCSPSCSTARAF